MLFKEYLTSYKQYKCWILCSKKTICIILNEANMNHSITQVRQRLQASGTKHQSSHNAARKEHIQVFHPGILQYLSWIFCGRFALFILTLTILANTLHVFTINEFSNIKLSFDPKMYTYITPFHISTGCPTNSIYLGATEGKVWVILKCKVSSKP